MLNARLLEFAPSRLFIKERSKKQIAEICVNTFFSLITIAATFLYLLVLILNSNEFCYFFVYVPLLC